MDNDQKRNVYVSIVELTDLIYELLERYKIPVNDNHIYEILTRLIGDFLFPLPDQTYLNQTQEYIQSLNINSSQVYTEAYKLYCYLLFIVDHIGISDNRFYLDKTTCEIINKNLMKITYDPRANTYYRSI